MGDCRSDRCVAPEARARVFDGDDGDVPSRGVRGVAGRRVAGDPRVREVSFGEHRRDRPRTGRQVCGVLAGFAGLSDPGRGGGDRDSTVVCRGHESRLRGGYPDRETEGTRDAQALHGGEAVRTGGGDPVADLGRDACVDLLGIADASGNGGAESRVSARADVGRRGAGGVGPCVGMREALAL